MDKCQICNKKNADHSLFFLAGYQVCFICIEELVKREILKEE